MSDPVFNCLYQSKGLIEKPHEIWSTTVEFMLVVLVIFIGVALNYRFLMKLKEEKRKRPLGRKGNVIEPIASLFCIVQMLYWPFGILFFWSSSNEIIRIDHLSGWWPNILMEMIRVGRLYLGWNSFFVALIRYIYIVHRERSNQWDFENIGRIFRIASFTIPVFLQCIGIFTHNWSEYQSLDDQEWLKDCISSNMNTSANDIQIPYPTYPLRWTMTFLSESTIQILWYIWLSLTLLSQSHLLEILLYSLIFLNIRRDNKRQLEIGVYNDDLYNESEKRSIISLQMCFMGWLYEVFSTIFVLIIPYLKQKHEIHNTYLTYPVIMFVAIPGVHILNDEDTKAVIYQEGWFGVVKLMLGVNTQDPEENMPTRRERTVEQNNLERRHDEKLSDRNQFEMVSKSRNSRMK